MIVFLCEESLPIEPFAAMLRHQRRSVWGPFHALLGKLGGRDGEDCIVARAKGNAAFHAGGRLAAHHGARLVVGFGPSLAEPSAWEELGASTSIVPVADVVDLAPLEELQCVTSDLAPSDSIRLPEEAFSEHPFAATEGGLRCGTTVFPLTIPALGRLLRRREGIAVFDTNAIGLAHALDDSRIPGAMYSIVRGPITIAASAAGRPGFAPSIHERDQVAEFLEQQGWAAIQPSG